MNEEPKRRSIAVRLLLCLLSLFFYGLGLVRVGQIRRWLVIEGGGLAALVLIVLFWAVAPPLSITALLICALLIIVIGLAMTIAPVIETWRHSRFVSMPRPWPSRWYGLLLLYAISLTTAIAWVALAHQFYKPYFAPSSSMLPTIARGDKFVAHMRGGRDPRIGDILLFRVRSGHIYIGRVAALPGMTIEMRNGVPVVDGRPARQRRVGTMTVDEGYGPPSEALRLAETLPGETGEHEILDLGWRPTDDMPPVKLSNDQIFMLGDNRDMAADSRVPPEQMGASLLRLDAIAGKPIFFHWRQAEGFTAIPIGQPTPTEK